MLPKSIIFVLKLFDCLGFFTEWPPTTLLQKMRYICGVIFFGSFKVFNYNIALSSMGFFDKLNACIQLYGGLFTQNLIFIDAVFHRRNQRAFWTHFQYLIDCFGIEPHFYEYDKVLLKGGHLLILTVTHATISVWDLSAEDKLVFVTVLVAIRVYSIRILQYVIYMEIIRGNLKTMQMHAIEATVLCGTVKESLRKIRCLYSITHDMVDCLNGIFGYSQFQVVLFSYFVLLVDFNWVYTKVHGYSTLQQISNSFHFSASRVEYLLEFNYRSRFLYLDDVYHTCSSLFVSKHVYVHEYRGGSSIHGISDRSEISR